MGMTQMDLVQLRSYATALESFKTRITTYCNNMETGIQSCSKYMMDATSQKALQDGQKVVQDIKACLNPSQMLLDKIHNMINIMQSQQDFML